MPQAIEAHVYSMFVGVAYDREISKLEHAGNYAHPVIVVDDDEAVRDSLDAVLTAWGYRTSLYASGDAFLAGLDGLDEACVLLDLHMPGLDGIETARVLKAKSRHFHVVLMSARLDDAAREAAGDAGVDTMIEKPFNEKALLDAVAGASGTKST